MLTDFDPVLYSNAENRYLLTALGKPTVVAMREIPEGVNKAAVKPVIEKVYELMELEKHANAEWIGIDALKQSITTWLTQSEMWANTHRKGKPRFPSMYSFDSRGRGFRHGTGSDAGRVRTYFGPAGERIKFAVELVPSGAEPYNETWTQADMPKGNIRVDLEKHRIECLICNHTDSYNPDARSSYNAARGRMSKHLRTATEEVDRHREAYTQEFG